MRDFRDAKAMAHTLRAALAAKGLKITISQSLELVAEAFGVADWNTLAAAISANVVAGRNKAAPLPPPIADAIAGFSAELDATLHRALGYANQRKHKYATLEHLLVALTDDADASAVMRGCNADLGLLRAKLISYLDNELDRLVIDNGGAVPTAAFQRVVQRADRYARELGRSVLTGANILVAIFMETQSPAARLLGEQGMSHQDAAAADASSARHSPRPLT
jgi:hypothetical protein